MCILIKYKICLAETNLKHLKKKSKPNIKYNIVLVIKNKIIKLK